MASSFFDDPRMLAPRQTRRTDLGGGAFLLQSPEPLAPYARCVGEWLEQWARDTPETLAAAEPAPGGSWHRLQLGCAAPQRRLSGEALSTSTWARASDVCCPTTRSTTSC
jgi:hypothetical protein